MADTDIEIGENGFDVRPCRTPPIPIPPNIVPGRTVLITKMFGHQEILAKIREGGNDNQICVLEWRDQDSDFTHRNAYYAAFSVVIIGGPCSCGAANADGDDYICKDCRIALDNSLANP